MTCSKSEVNTLLVCKEGNISDTCAADMEQISIWLANNTGNE